MCYILALNGIIIANTGISKPESFFSTAVASGGFTLAMGLIVNVPVALAPGMGLNGYFNSVARTCPTLNPTGDINGVQCPSWGHSTLPWSDGMGAVFISGWIYLFFTVTGLRSMLFQAVPTSLRAAITIGIGFFITMIGLKIGELTRVTLADFAMNYGGLAGAADCTSLVGYASGTCLNTDLNFSWYENGMVNFNANAKARIAVLGLVFVSALEMLKVRGGIIIAISLATLIGINYPACDSLDIVGPFSSSACVTYLGVWNQPASKIPWIVDTASIISGKLTFKYANTPIFWEAVWTFLFVELFDSFGTLTGIMTRCGFMKGDPEKAMTRVNRAMLVDGWGLWLGAIIGSNSITCYIESNTGVEAGARTGLASVVTGASFLLTLLWMYPFVAVIPDAATTCALVMVGVYSLTALQEINYEDFVDLLTAFFTIATMGFTYSIANGISVGFIFFSWMRTVRWIQFKVCTYLNKPEYGPKEGVATDLPHPLMVVMSVFMCFRFRYLH
jgi:AGZA family xanthine/uracil permease-like MFS transporter